MDDITLPREDSHDDDTFFIRPVKTEDVLGMEKNPLDASDSGNAVRKPSADGDLSTTVESPLESAGLSSATSSAAPKDQVTIKFGKFVQLVAHHSYVEVVDKNADEDIIISSNLLTDLANAHDNARERRMPLIFVAGIMLGVALAYILLQ